MASDIERRIEKLEQALQSRTRPEWVAIYADQPGDVVEEKIAQYEAATPEPERAENRLIINCVFPRDAVPVIAPAVRSGD